MTILLTADHHIKLGAKNVPVDWAKNRFTKLFEQINAIDCNLHIMPGDIFDRVPSVEELELYFKFVKGAKVRTLVSTGNHEATKKGKSFFSALKEATNAINPLVEVVDEIYTENNWTIVPYEFIHKKETWDNVNTDYVFTHVRGNLEPHVKSEIPLEWLEKFKVVFAGDLHSHSNTQANIVYPGSPLTTSFHREKVKTGYILISEPNLSDWSWHEFKLPQLIRKTISDPAEIIATDYDLTVYELEGDVIDLSKVKDSDLLDKKLVKRSSDTALILNKDMSIADELNEYLQFIMELPMEKIKRVMGTFHDYAAKDS